MNERCWGCDKEPIAIYVSEHDVSYPLCEEHLKEWADIYSSTICANAEDCFLVKDEGQGPEKLNVGRCKKKVIDKSGMYKKFSNIPTICWLGNKRDSCAYFRSKASEEKVSNAFALLLEGVTGGKNE